MAMQGNCTPQSIVDAAVLAGMDALPQRLSVRELAAAAQVSLGSLQRAFDIALGTTPVAYIQRLCIQRARRDLRKAALGDTVFAIARRWGFASPDGVFRDGYRALYGERPCDTLKRARSSLSRVLPVADDHVRCLECGHTMRRLRRHLAQAHGLTPDAYRRRWRVPKHSSLVCGELSQQLSARARANNLTGKGARARQPWRSPQTIPCSRRIDGTAMPSAVLVEKIEHQILAALPVRLSERYVAKLFSLGMRELRRAFFDERGATAYIAMRRLRLREAHRRMQADRTLSLDVAAKTCGFGYVARFRRDLQALLDTLRPSGRRAVGESDRTAQPKSRNAMRAAVSAVVEGL